MTTPELKNKIEAAANKALVAYAAKYPGAVKGTFFYGIRQEQELQHNKPVPHIYCNPLTSKKNRSSGVIKWRDILIAFIDKDESDSLTQQRTPILDRMHWLSEEFQTLLLDEDDEMENDIEIQEDDIVNDYTLNGTGKLITIPKIESVEALC